MLYKRFLPKCQCVPTGVNKCDCSLLLSKTFPAPHVQRGKNLFVREDSEFSGLFWLFEPLAIATQPKDGMKTELKIICLSVNNLMHG